MLSKPLLTAVAARNVIIGGSPAALRLLARPPDLVNYASESLFLLRAYLGHRNVAQRHVHDVLGLEAPVPVTLIEPYSGAWAPPCPSYTVDLVALAILCRALEPATIFEIGTSIGHTTAHFAMNSPEDARVYTLDLPPGTAPALRTTYTDARHVDATQRNGQCVFEGTSGEHKVRRLYGFSAPFPLSQRLGTRGRK
ncbi:MAG TPA: hypothetical protein VF188_09395 [Longimicrobiales bacterium]